MFGTQEELLQYREKFIAKILALDNKNLLYELINTNDRYNSHPSQDNLWDYTFIFNEMMKRLGIKNEEKE